ncbi:UDP-N-acetylglucosamine diphosphorylase/glucosamine-1-phosphate N-acetyltransferase [Halovivax ruber XH-70]|uniref:Bifunctional protein GlmU n=1 Tax=Halovivax ruber (strain DSM 18193 / JCM 13892 / XH-70) TaxID=797302 RepID=L0ICF5_HALRX|nr:bifunctional sugar-1-phosphate nucleotidylyltransferase/acetyltransferase [Halovivax ruber]AGB15647.1 UDP-N-acetylglucosamine diphosphorylase/glucosamine-1-phosphate N-acetyltransferase [Halovivax ruber XH-70]
MQTVVLAAGKGTRMRPLTDRRPKPMVPVANRPLVAHTVDAAVEAGASWIFLVVGYEAEPIREYFGETYAGVPITYVRQTERLGTADAVRAASASLDDAPFVVLNGDALFDQDGLDELFDGGPAIASVRVDDPTQYGVLDVDDDTVTGIVEKPADPPSNLINAGAYHFPAAAREWLDVPKSERGEHELTDVVEHTIDRVDVRPVPLSRWLDVGRPWELLEANEWKIAELADRHGSTTDAASAESFDGTVSDDATIRGPVVVESGATVREGVTIEGPALIRSGATVGPNAYIRGTTLVGQDASVGHAVEVKNSVLMAGAAINHLSYVGDSILGRDVNFGAGSVVANLRHDDDPVELTVKGERVSTGRRKFGVVLGDDAKTGIDTNLNAGVTLSTGATTKPGESVTRDR